MFYLGLLVNEKHSCSVVVDKGVGPGLFRTGIDLIDGKEVKDPSYPAKAHQGIILERGKPAKIKCIVKRNEVVIENNGRQIFQWRGDPSTLSLMRNVSSKGLTGKLFVGTWSSSVKIDRLQLRPIKNDPRSLADLVNQPNTQPQSVPSALSTPRSKVPDEKAQGASRREIRKIFKTEFNEAKQPNEIVALARRLQRLAAETRGDPATKYVLYDEAIGLAIRCQQFELALDFVAEQAKSFDLDSLVAKMSALKDAENAARFRSERTRLVKLTNALINEAVDQGRFDEAVDAAALGVNLAARTRDFQLRNQTRDRRDEIVDLKKRSDLAKLARERLKTEPDNPKANLALGKFLCLVNHDWQNGLPFLTKGDDAQLKAAADLDLSGPDTEAKRLKVADAWFNLGKSAGRYGQVALLARAVNWYKMVSTSGGGLTKIRAGKQLAEITKLAPAAQRPQSIRVSLSLPAATTARSNRTINLMPLIDPAIDQVHGGWKFVNGVLVCKRTQLVAKIQIPYQPPEEYDFKVMFMQPKLRNTVKLIMPTSEGSFVWVAGGKHGGYEFVVVQSGGTKGISRRIPGLIQPNHQHTTVVQVRKNSLKAFVDGQLILSYDGQPAELETTSQWYRIRDKSLLAVGCDDPTFFHVVEVTEISGNGRVVRVAN